MTIYHILQEEIIYKEVLNMAVSDRKALRNSASTR